MDAQEILSRLKQQDKETFRRMVTEYGKGLYLRLYAVSGDPDAARKATKAAFTELYMALNSQQGPDVIESLLYSIGEKKQREILQQQAMKVVSECVDSVVDSAVQDAEQPAGGDTVPGAHTAVPEQPRAAGGSNPAAIGQRTSKEKTGGIVNAAFALMMIAGLWLALGALMGDGCIPKCDLGYSWFNTNVAEWFMWL